MREAGVTVATVGVFSWALLEPEQGRFDLDWLDEVLDLLHARRRRRRPGHRHRLTAALAVPPATPRPSPGRRDGTVLWPGSRQAWCPSSPVFRERPSPSSGRWPSAYHDHPALVMWHVSNELRLPQQPLLLRRLGRGVPRWLGALRRRSTR